MCTEIDKHCEIGHKRFLMSSIETENQLSYCGSTIEPALHGVPTVPSFKVKRLWECRTNNLNLDVFGKQLRIKGVSKNDQVSNSYNAGNSLENQFSYFALLGWIKKYFKPD